MVGKREGRGRYGKPIALGRVVGGGGTGSGGESEEGAMKVDEPVGGEADEVDVGDLVGVLGAPIGHGHDTDDGGEGGADAGVDKAIVTHASGHALGDALGVGDDVAEGVGAVASPRGPSYLGFGDDLSDRLPLTDKDSVDGGRVEQFYGARG